MYKYLAAVFMLFASAAQAEIISFIPPTFQGASPTRFVMEDQNTLHVQGDFNSGYSIHLAQALEATRPDTLKITSLGGISIEGFSAAMVIKTYQMDVPLNVVAGMCIYSNGF